MKLTYIVKTKNLVEFFPLTLFFGVVDQGVDVNREIMLQSYAQTIPIEIKVITTPKEITVEKCNDTETNKTYLKATFLADRVGVYKGDIVLAVSDHKGNKQELRLNYFAFAQ
ncbi:MAG: hypothetical protein KAV87_65985 [Desulfobacteraceae bacterium]|nr:hypothetical protein [Desulfobacteraceae bacterium]